MKFAVHFDDLKQKRKSLTMPKFTSHIFVHTY